LRLLARRWHTTKRLAEKLAQRGIGQEEIQEVIRRMTDLGYLDDQRYAETWLEEKLAAKKWGPRRLRAELIKQGIAPELAEKLLAEAFPPGEERQLELALALARKKAADPGRWREKTGAALERAGFEYEVIRQALNIIEKEKVLDSHWEKD
jgi:regulatory protein